VSPTPQDGDFSTSLTFVLDALDAATVRRWAAVTRTALAARREQIDALNVFPVDDGDTGTNLYLTFDGALEALRDEGRPPDAEVSVSDECAALARVSLLTARGNSGVIFSQLIRGFADAVSELGPGGIDAAAVARGLSGAARWARDAVAHPVEGTVLTVADATAAAAAGTTRDAVALDRLTEACVTAAATALDATPSQLEVLRRAGVVDAGGAGFLLFVEALDRVVRGLTPTAPYAVDAVLVPRSPPSDELRRGRRDRSAENGSPPAVEHDTAAVSDGCAAPGDVGGSGDGGAYEVMYLLDDASDATVRGLRSTLDALGDSLLVIGGPEVWNVHIHTDDIGAAIEAGVGAGRPYRIRITPLPGAGTVRRPRDGTGVVACAAGPGIGRIFEEAGGVPLASGPQRRASAGEILDAARRTGAADVIVLPNDRDTLMSSEAAARAALDEGMRLHVVPSTTAVQGMAAIAVHDPDLPVARDVLGMAGASAATRHGAVTVAVKAGLTSGGPCQVGDVLGIINGDIDIVGGDRTEVATEVVARLLAGGGELVTVVVGADAPPDLAERLTRAVHEMRREAEVHVLDGGQPHYDLLIGVE
jgi:DAK2 domain fusion protein YloV